MIHVYKNGAMVVRFYVNKTTIAVTLILLYYGIGGNYSPLKMRGMGFFLYFCTVVNSLH